MSKKKIPQTDSIQELADFWDTHDLTDFDDQLEEVKEQVFERKNSVNVPLESKEVEAVKKIAKSKGVESADLIREWIQEKISTS